MRHQRLCSELLLLLPLLTAHWDDGDHFRPHQAAALSPKRATITSRRRLCQSSCASVLGALLTDGAGGSASGTAAAIWWLPQPCRAACLAGDDSPDCIGVYKVPIDTVDAVRNMPQALQQNAPDVRLDRGTTENTPTTATTTTAATTMPSTFPAAWQVLAAQRRAADDIAAAVRAGDLTQAGQQVLRLVPQVTLAGRYVVDHVAQTSTLTGALRDMQLAQLQDGLDATVAAWADVDVTLGQGLRGELGVVTVVQLVVLEQVRDAVRAYDDWLARVPKPDG